MNAELAARRFSAPLPDDIPRIWLPGMAAVVAYLNTYTVLVPANEAFYIRTINACLPRVADPALRAAAQGFIHQEAEHGVAHKRYWRNLEAQGYRFRGFERAVDKLTFRVMEKIAPLSLRLSMVACVEHINAFLAHEFLSQRVLADADPQMRALMEWHFAEEIEHKQVSFDVLRAVAPSYAMRLLGLAATAPLFYLVLGVGTLRFLAQDGQLLRGATWRGLWRHLFGGHRMAARTLKHLWDYARPGFDPANLDDAALAREVIERYAGRDWLAPAGRGVPARPRPA